MRIYGWASLVLLASILETTPAMAQSGANVSITPYVALGTEAAPPVGAAVEFPITTNLFVEADVAYRRGEGNIHATSTSASLLWHLPRVGNATPYLVGGIGLAQYGTPVNAFSGPPIGTRRAIGVMMNAGGGVKMPINEKLDWRTDARWLKTIGQGSDQFRVAQGVSFDVGRR